MSQNLQVVLEQQVAMPLRSLYAVTEAQLIKSAETIAKMRKGKGNGHPQTEYAKQVASKTHKGKVVSAETRAKQSAAHLDIEIKHEHAAKISKALKGKRHSADHRAKLSEAGCGVKKQTVTPLGVFKSRSAAARAHGVVGTTIADWTKRYPDKFYYILEQK